MTQHSIFIYSPVGEPLRVLRWKSIDCSLVERDIGYLTVALFPEYRDDLFQRDSRIAYLQSPEGVFIESGKLVGDTMWLLTGRKRVLTDAGQHTIVLTCQHPNALLARRVVAYDEGTPEADKVDIGSDAMYDYVDQNFVTATDAARNLSSAHFVLDPRPSPTFGASLSGSGSYRTVKDILDEIAQSSAAQGAYVGYEIYVQQPPGPFRCRFYSRVRGANRGLTSGQPLILGPFTASMRRASVSEDWSTAVSFVYAGGSGKQDERTVSTAEDTTLSAQSPFGRYELFESTNGDDPGMAAMLAEGTLRDYRPRRQFDGTVTPVAEQYSGAIYGSNYTWGDIVGARFQAPILNNFNEAYAWQDYLFDVRVNPVHFRVVRKFDDYGNQVGDIEETTEIFLQSVSSAGQS